MDMWKSARIEFGTSLHWRLGLLEVWLERVEPEWRGGIRRVPVLYDAGKEADEKLGAAAAVVAVPEAKPEDVPWSRMLVEDDSTEYRLVPALPDRPVVVRPESPVLIPPGGRAAFYVSIPLWVRLTVGAGGKAVLIEEPTVVLSNIWFGDVTAGELCYSLKTRARAHASPEQARAHRAACPVRVKNSHAKNLDFQRLCIHVEALDIYDGPYQLWTSRLDVEYLGEDQPARIRPAAGAPADKGAEALVTPARKPAPKGILSRAFGKARP